VEVLLVGFGGVVGVVGGGLLVVGEGELDVGVGVLVDAVAGGGVVGFGVAGGVGAAGAVVSLDLFAVGWGGAGEDVDQAALVCAVVVGPEGVGGEFDVDAAAEFGDDADGPFAVDFPAGAVGDPLPLGGPVRAGVDGGVDVPELDVGFGAVGVEDGD